MPDRPLRDQVAVVAGATRGAGRGIARMLGEAGATVYCTGRSVRGHPATPGRPETLEETAEMVTAEGGRGIAVRTDHTVESKVEQLFARVRAEAGRLDVLVNDIWGGDALTEWGKSFWELSVEQGQRLLERAVHTHIITSRHGAPLMVKRNAGLIVEVTDGDTPGYRGNLFYDLAKNAVVRLAYAMASDLHAHGVTALAITPGFLRSEAVLDHFGVTEANWRDAIEKDEYFTESETPCYVGRAIAALAADPDVGTKSGGLFSSWALAKEYGFTDVDGRRPDWGTFFLRKVREILERDAVPGAMDQPNELDLFVVRSRLYQAELDPSAAAEAERLRAWLARHE
ncbi:SDR family oxidoreductase [Candidatus Palauibacter sp.]|uniref:SDR family oxidoreductase n=1 Tax=Candidatus Palauibacter sp. TaxID=3101350 RepID=UPI003B0179CE